MTGCSNGGSFGTNSNTVLMDVIGNAVGTGAGRWPVPRWKFGLRLSDDRGSV